MENAPLRISTDPLAFDSGDTALSDVWSDKPLSAASVATRLQEIKSKTAVKYVLPNEDGAAELWEKAENEASPIAASAPVIGSMRTLLYTRAEGLKNPLADSDDEEVIAPLSRVDRKQTVYRFGY